MTDRVKLRYHLEALPVRFALAVLRRLNPVTASNLGGAIARFIGPLLPVTRVGDENMRRTMPELDAAARQRILRDVWENLGRTIAELPHLNRLRLTDSGYGFEVVGAEVLHHLRETGGAAIIFSAHIGNWELLPPSFARFGILASSFYRAASNPIVNAIMVGLRDAGIGEGVPNFPKGAKGARAALSYLKAGGVLGMLVDQKMNDGIEAPFFGLPAMTAPAATAFALRFGCPLIPAHIERLGPARFRLVVEQSLDVAASDDRQADILALTTAMNAKLEEWIRARPGEWLWLHRRWPKPQPAAES